MGSEIAYHSLRLTVINLQQVHRSQNGPQGLDGVAVNDRLVKLPFLV